MTAAPIRAGRDPVKRTGAGILAWRANMPGHTDWCARDHTCGLGEHRAQPVILYVPGRGRIVLTRVLASDGRQHAEIRTRIVLAGSTHAAASRHLAHVLAELDRHLQVLARIPRP